MQTLSVKDCLSYAWSTFKSRPWIFVQAGILLFLVNMAVSLVQSGIELGGKQGGETMAGIAVVISAILGIGAAFLASMGETAFFLKAHDDATSADLADLWHPRPFWKFVGASILAGLIVFVGILLLVVPGIIAAILFTFVGYVVIEEKLGPLDALKRSRDLTKGNRFKLFQLGLALIGVNILGFAAIFVGLLVTIPLSFLAVVHAYRTLSGSAQEAIVLPEEVLA